MSRQVRNLALDKKELQLTFQGAMGAALLLSAVPSHGGHTGLRWLPPFLTRLPHVLPAASAQKH